ncbi:MAG: T9SS type A sorting domain-containing protein, partial [Bacteroidota bacterium]
QSYVIFGRKTNAVPVVNTSIEDQEFTEGFGTSTISVEGVFTDADEEDMLTFSITSSEESVVTVAIAEGTITLTEVGVGTSTITVTADDGNGGSITDQFTVTVNADPCLLIDATVTLEGETLTASETGVSYQWLDCDNGNTSVEGATEQSFTPETSGNYAVQLSAEGCVVLSDCVEIDIILSIEGGWVSDIKLYPNPVRDRFSIVLDQTYTDVTLRLRDSRGVLLEEKDYRDSSTIEYELKARPGIYFVELNTGDKMANITIKKD